MPRPFTFLGKSSKGLTLPGRKATSECCHGCHESHSAKSNSVPISNEIERVEMPDRFARPPFNCYDRKTDLVEHVSHYIQMMFLHTHNDALMCKVFLLSLGPTALRWFNGLRKGSIRSFSELIQEFGVWFVTCSRVPQLVDVLLSMKMRAGETLRSYASRYWELYNEIGGDRKSVV